MRRLAMAAVVLMLGGCGLRYMGTEDQMQQVARGTAELMKKNPYSDTVSGAGTAAHMALSMAMGPEKAEQANCTPGLNGCYEKGAVTAAPSSGSSMESFTGLPADHYKSTSIGKD